MTNPVWVWAIEQRLTGYGLNKAFHGPRSKDVGPCWSFSRYGRTETMLPDGHSSELVEDGGALLVRRGLICGPRWPAVVENIDDWRMDLHTGRWERLTRRLWPRFAFVRDDGCQNHLFWLRRRLSDRASGRSEDSDGFRAKYLGDLSPNLLIDLLETLYTPDVPHSKMPKITSCLSPVRRRHHRALLGGLI